MEKSQKEIKILTKGGEEITLRIRKIFPLTDDQLTRLVERYLTAYLYQWGSDDDMDYQPYNTIFDLLTGEGKENYADNLFLKEDLEKAQEYGIDDYDAEHFYYEGEEYTGLMELVDKWLETNYPKAIKAGWEIEDKWENSSEEDE